MTHELRYDTRDLEIMKDIDKQTRIWKNSVLEELYHGEDQGIRNVQNNKRSEDIPGSNDIQSKRDKLNFNLLELRPRKNGVHTIS